MTVVPGFPIRPAFIRGGGHNGRRSPVLLLTLGLSLATALALLSVGATLFQPTVAVSTTSQREVAEGFYDAVNNFLRTGNAAALDALVAPDLTIHDARSGADQDRPGFERHLAALRAADPSLQLGVADVIVEGDRAAVSLEVRSSRTGMFLGVPLDGRSRPWAEIDVLRVAGGRVAERWAVGEPGIVLQPLLRARLDRGRSESGGIGVARLAFAPGAGVTRVSNASAILFVVEAGELRVRADGPVVLSGRGGGSTDLGAGVVTSADRVLRPGDAVVVPGEARVELRNDGVGPAVALGISLAAALASPDSVLRGIPTTGQGEEAGTARSSGIAVQPLAASSTVPLPSGPISVELGLAILDPGASLPPHASAAVEVFAVASGGLGLVVAGPATLFDRGADRAQPPIAADVLDAGVTLASTGAAVVYGGAVASLRNPGDDPVVVWVLTISPVESEPGWDGRPSGEATAPPAPTQPSEGCRNPGCP